VRKQTTSNYLVNHQRLLGFVHMPQDYQPQQIVQKLMLGQNHFAEPN
jgi:hypothetical protein